MSMYFLNQLAFHGLQRFALAWNGVIYNNFSIETGMMSLLNLFLIFNMYLFDS